MLGVRELAAALRSAIEAALAESAPDNPVYRVRESQVMREVLKTDRDQFILNRFDRLENAVQQVVNAAALSRRSRLDRDLLRDVYVAVSTRPELQGYRSMTISETADTIVFGAMSPAGRFNAAIVVPPDWRTWSRGQVMAEIAHPLGDALRKEAERFPPFPDRDE